MKTETEIVQELMTKYGLTKKDLFSFCICAVNFLEYYQEESMYDVMRNCPERYANADSNNTRAVAGALKGEKEAEHWTDEQQFAYYMRVIQETIADDQENENLEYVFDELVRFDTVYKREIMIPIMLGCPVEEFDSEQSDDEEYLTSVINTKGMTLRNTYEEQRDAEMKAFREKEAAKLAGEIKEKEHDGDFCVLLASCTDITRLKVRYEEYNKTYYPTRDYKVTPLTRPNQMIIQTGGKDIDDVKETIMKIFKRSISIIGHEMKEEMFPVEKAYKGVVPKILQDNKVTHVIAYY